MLIYHIYTKKKKYKNFINLTNVNSKFLSTINNYSF